MFRENFVGDDLFEWIQWKLLYFSKGITISVFNNYLTKALGKVMEYFKIAGNHGRLMFSKCFNQEFDASEKMFANHF